MATMGELKCPVCKAALPADKPECPTCGLPKELWPTSPEAGGQPGGLSDELLADLMKGLADLEAPMPGPAPASAPPKGELPPVGAESASRAPGAPRAPPGPSGMKEVEPVVVGPQKDGDGMALSAVLDDVQGMVQLGRRAGFDLAAYSPEVTRAIGLMRSQQSERAHTSLLSLRKRIYDDLGRRFAGRVEEIEVKLARFRTFLRTDQADVHLKAAREALAAGDLAKGQVELRRLEGESGRLESDLGTLGQTLEQVDLLTSEVERMGGDTAQALLYQGKALEAARRGDRGKAEGLLSTASALLLDALAPLMGRELVRMTERIKGQRSQGRDIRALVALVRLITVDLKTRNYSRAVSTLTRLREEIEQPSEAAAS